MRPAEPILIEAVAYSHPDVTELTTEVQDYYVRIYGGPDTTPVDPAEFDPPAGAFFVGYLHGRPTAMGGWRFRSRHLPFADGVALRPAEIKRMYVITAARGLGLARQMLHHLENTARLAGADAVVLETGQAQPDAVGLYRSAGYIDIPPFGHYAGEPDAVNLGKRL